MPRLMQCPHNWTVKFDPLGQVKKNTSWSSGIFEKRMREVPFIYYLLFFSKMAAGFLIEDEHCFIKFKMAAGNFNE